MIDHQKIVQKQNAKNAPVHIDLSDISISVIVTAFSAWALYCWFIA